MSKVKIKKENFSKLSDYSKIPISFQVESVYRIELKKAGIEGLDIYEEKVETPYLKDYDVFESPLVWPSKFDLKNWAVFFAYINKKIVGGATVALNSKNVKMLDGRDDISVLWDIRVMPKYRNKSVGSKLLEKCESLAKRKKCKMMKIETQNINVEACKFYKSHDYFLGGYHQFGYACCPDEIMFLWYKKLTEC